MAVQRRRTLRTTQPSGPVQLDPYWLKRGLVHYDVGNGWIWTKQGGWQGPKSRVGPPKLQTDTKLGAVKGYGTTYGTGTTDRTDGPPLSPAAGFRSLLTFSYAKSYGGGNLGRIYQPAGKAGNTAGDESWYISSASSYEVLYQRVTDALNGAWCIAGLPVLNAWVGYGLTHDQRTVGQTPAMYKNGALVTTSVLSASTGNYVAGSINLDIGNRSTDGARGWDGMLGPMLIFDHPDSGLTASEHKLLFENPYRVALGAARRSTVTASSGLTVPLLTSTSTLYTPTVGTAGLSVPLLTNTATLYAPLVGSIIQFDDSFERSNIDISKSSVDEDSYAPTIRIYPRLQISENVPGTPGYEVFYTKITGALNKRPNFKVRYYTTPSSGILDRWFFQSTQRFMWSYDQTTWNYFDTHALSGDNLNIDFKENADFTSDTVYVCSIRPWTVSQTTTMVASLASTYSSYVSMPPSSSGLAYVHGTMGTQTDERGRTIPAQPLYSLRITDDTQQPDDGSVKRIAVMIAGQHASEDVGNWMLKGAVEFLCGTDPKAIAARKNFEWYIYPMTNPMGRYGGHWRGDFNSVNPTYDTNRHWVTTPGIESTTKTMAAMATDFGSRKPTVFFDFHGGYSGNFIYSGSTLYSAFLTKMLVYTSGITTFGDNPVNSSCYWAANTRTASLATFIESSRDLTWTEAQTTDYGATVIKSVSDLFADGAFPAIVPPLLTNSSTLYAPTVGDGGLSMPLLTDTVTLYAPVVGDLGLYPPLITDTVTLFEPTVESAGIFPPLISDASVLYAPALSSGGIFPPLLTSTGSLFVPLVGTIDTLGLILKILANRQELNPTTGKFTLYDDDGVTVLYNVGAWADVEGTVPYTGGHLARIDRLQ